MFKNIIFASALLLVAGGANADEYRASEIVGGGVSSAITSASDVISKAVDGIDVALGEFIVSAPYIPTAIENKYQDSKYERDFKQKCQEPELEAGKILKEAMQTEFTVMWCAETYGEYVNNWRKEK